MSGAAETTSADPLPSLTSLNGNRQPWDFSVPAGPEVCTVFLFLLFLLSLSVPETID